MKTLIRLIRDETGATAIEYGLIAGLVSICMLVGLTAFSTELQTTIDKITTAMQTAW